MKNNIEFLEDTHTYLINGVIVPSVSELIRFKFPDAYKGVPKRILKSKATYGTKVHATIEAFVNKEFTLEELQKKNIDPDIKIAVEQFELLRNIWCFYVGDMEQIVSYKDKYAGTYDIRTQDDYIIDIKTTSEIHDEWLSWQLGLYYLALGVEKPHGFVMWVPKGKVAEVKQINVKSFDECKQLVEDYEKANPSND